MAKTKAFTKFINPYGTSKDEDFSVNQSSPTWVLSFVRWDVRDTLRAVAQNGNQQELIRIRKPLVVENDCVQVSTVINKAVLTPSFDAILKITDVNYETAVAPGDFVFINMLNWESDARRVALLAKSGKGPLNGPKDGFKGFYKVQSVRRVKLIDPQSGVKRVAVKISGFAFTEFNNKIYYNPYLRRENQGTDKDNQIFPVNLQSDYSQLINPNQNPTCRNLIKLLIQSFVGVGVSDRGSTSVGGLPITPNTHFYIPQQVGTFLGVSGVTAAKDVYNYLFGLQRYSGGSSQSQQDLAKGLNPSNLGNSSNRFYFTSDECLGNTLLKPDYWNQVQAWSIINQYTNSPVNEIYTSFRVDPSGKVMPTVVFRQIPFTSDLFGKKDPFISSVKVTNFLSLPRWKIDSALVLNEDLGRDEAARVNYVQYYSAPPSNIGKPQNFLQAQTAAMNFVYDINDVLRNGLRPYIVTTNFEELTITKSASIARDCALILGDALMGGHLKLNGTVETVGITDPISVGDNFEYDGTVFHIEEINHNCAIDPITGIKTFRTVLKLSHGVSVADSSSGLAYPEMVHTNAYQDRLDNFVNGNKTLPGVSEAQDTVYRETNPTPDPLASEISAKDQPFAQPGAVIKPIKDKE